MQKPKVLPLDSQAQQPGATGVNNKEPAGASLQGGEQPRKGASGLTHEFIKEAKSGPTLWNNARHLH
jgi:hypothetical protein